MNRNVIATILIVLAIGIYFTFTRAKITELQNIRAVNAQYQKAIDDSDRLIKLRDATLATYNSLSDTDKDRLNKIVPNNVDNVRLVIDVKDDIAAHHGLVLKNIKTSSPDTQQQTGGTIATNVSTAMPGDTSVVPNTNNTVNKYGIVTLSFDVSTNYQTFLDFLKDLESSLRIMDISKLTVKANETGTYDFSVEVKTYWLK